MKTNLFRYYLICILMVGIMFLVPRQVFAYNMGYHYDLIRDAAVKEGLNLDAYSVLLAGNSYTDFFQANDVDIWFVHIYDTPAKLMIDDAFCEESLKLVDYLHFDQLYDQKLVDKYWRQLIQNTHDAVVDKVNKNDKLGLLMAMGVSIHITEDFYSHSNWAELDLPRFTGVKDATYFDVVQNYPGQLDTAINFNNDLPFHRYPDEVGLFTHGNDKVPRPAHDVLKKDYAGRPYFDWSYRAAYKASLQWLRLIKKWICDDLKRPDFWNELKSYNYPGNKTNLYRLTSIDDGTIRWLHTYGGAWKNPEQWSASDMVSDNLPNVPGIGITEQYDQDYPYLGIEWFSSCALIAKNLFEAAETDKIERNAGVDNLDKALAGPKEDFEDTVSVKNTIVDISTLPALNNDIVNQAIATLADSLGNTYDGVRWLRIEIPEAKDLDTGGGLLDGGVNNEEWGGTSDYWVMFTVDGLGYSEAEYVDQSNPHTLWGVIKPLWNNNPVNVKIEMFESDPSNHKDERMDICPGNPNDLTFTINPADGKLMAPPANYVWYSLSDGCFIEGSGTGDLEARVDVRAWMMSDNRIEFIGRTGPGFTEPYMSKQLDDVGSTDSLIWGQVGSRMWLLDRPHLNKFIGTKVSVVPGMQFIYEPMETTRILTFDPGIQWTGQKLGDFNIHKDKSDNWFMAGFYVKTGGIYTGADPGLWITDDRLSYRFGGYSPEQFLTAADMEKPVHHITVITKTTDKKDADTNNKVYITFLDKNNTILAKYILADLMRDHFKRGNQDFFWLQEQNNVDGYTYHNSSSFPVKNIAKVKLEKPGDDDWQLQDLEVWVNDKALYDGSPNVTFTEDNPGRLSWEFTVTAAPKAVQFTAPAQIISQGIKPVAPDAAVKGHWYQIEATVNLLGYTSKPEVNWQLSPRPQYAEVTPISTDASTAKVRLRIAVSRVFNPEFDYHLQVTVKQGADTKTGSTEISLPKPSAIIKEVSFLESQAQVPTDSKLTTLIYTGSYQYQAQNFGVDSKGKLKATWVPDKSAETLLQTATGIQLKFTVPPYQYLSRLKLKLQDVDGVHDEVETGILISVPRLAGDLKPEYLNKTKSYLEFRPTASKRYIQPLAVNDPDYRQLFSQSKESGAVYNTIRIKAQVYLAKNGILFTHQLSKLSFDWRVTADGKPLPFVHPKPQQLLKQISSMHLTGNLTGSTKPTNATTPVFTAIDTESIIDIDLSGVEEGDKVQVICEVTDEAGQKIKLALETGKNTGISESDGIKLNLSSVFRLFQQEIYESFNFQGFTFANLPVANQNKVNNLSPKTKALYTAWESLRRLYILAQQPGSYKDQALQSNLRDANLKLIKLLKDF